MAAPVLSLIIPCGPLETAAPRIISSGLELPESWERILSLGPEPNIAPPPDWTLILGHAGRGAQLNRAASRASGEWLWFVHADSLPDAKAVRGVGQFILASAPRASSGRLGYCRLEFDGDGPAPAAINAIGANWRSRLFDLPYGDQGLCLRKRDLIALGGFREDIERGEDLDLVVRAKAAGISIERFDGTLLTSARRYRENGWLRTTVAHQLAAIRLILAAKRRAPP